MLHLFYNARNGPKLWEKDRKAKADVDGMMECIKKDMKEIGFVKNTTDFKS